MVSKGFPTPVLASVLLVALLLAGCSGGGGGGGPDDLTPELDVTSTTGGIRGVVVDEAVRPIKGATVEVTNPAKSVTTDETGVFTFSGLEPGTYFVKASHPLYDLQQQNVEVAAGVADPKPVKFLLTRVVFAQPYLQTLKFDGFIVCSANIEGLGYSEECGEGVGVPGVGRVGKQDGNFVQFDFTVGAGTKTVVVEQAWTPTSEAGRAFFTIVSTEWVCDPFCGGNRIINLDGESPLYGAFGEEDLADIVPDETIVTMFTYASFTSNPVGVVLNQKFQNFVTTFHYLPAPEGWSLVNGDPSPY